MREDLLYDLRVNKSWASFRFWVNYPFKNINQACPFKTIKIGRLTTLGLFNLSLLSRKLNAV